MSDSGRRRQALARTAGSGLLALLVGGGVSPAWSQQEERPPPAAPADVESIDAIIGAVYEVISGPAGAPRDWNRMRSLFLPEARLVRSFRKADGGIGYTALTLEEWIDGAGEWFAENPFFEKEIHRVTERFGHIAHAFSTYDSRAAPEAEPFSRGINSIQLLRDAERWWILTIFWQAENPQEPIPGRYLP